MKYDISDILQARDNILQSYHTDEKKQIYIKKRAKLVDSGNGHFLRTDPSSAKPGIRYDIYEHLSDVLCLEHYSSGDMFELSILVKKIG